MDRACSRYGGERKVAYMVLVRKHREVNHSEDADVDGRIILKCIFEKWDVGAWTGSIWLSIGEGGGLL
jgi:hypothetical protein